MSVRESTKPPLRRLVQSINLPASGPAAENRPANSKPPGAPGARQTKSRLPWFLFFAGLAAAILAGAQFYRANCKLATEASTTRSRELPGVPMKDFVAAPGLVESASGTLRLAFEKGGKVRVVHVSEGQHVKAGQLVAELVNDEESAKLEHARAELSVAEADHRSLASELKAEEARARREVERCQADLELARAGPRKEEIERAKARVKAAEVENRWRAEDAKRYVDPAISSGQERDIANSQAEITAAQLAAEHAKLRELESGTRAEEIDRSRAVFDAAKAKLECILQTRELRLEASSGRIGQARARVTLAEADLNRTRLVSPIDGVVLWKFHYAGESLGAVPPEPVVGVADPSKLRVRADVDESDFARVKPGQNVMVTCEAHRGRFFPGKVELVSDAAGQKRFTTGNPRERMDVKVVETVVSLEDAAPFKLGLPVSVYIESIGPVSK